MKKLTTTLALLLMISAASLNVVAQDMSDKEGVKMAALDYVEGLYLVQPERIERSVSKDLAKIGYWKRDATSEYRESPMTYDQLYSLAGKWNKEGKVDADTAPKIIEVLDLMDQTAVVKLSADWGIDYLNMAKKDGRWTIVNILWQSYPSNDPQ
ncbi:MAG: nuclear transport factor 2 family protein [Rhodothermaceae bacterium]|nr:nuclear transport factor 2 family protein [Rhodothermaceae bacterium]